jgi:quercetin dioxygenase-like cupin family protein
VVLERLAAALGVTLASLFDAPVPADSPVVRRAQQPVWRDPESGYLRRNVTPAGADQPARIVEVEFPAGARVAFDTGPRDVPVRQQVWVLQGSIRVMAGAQEHRLDEGDCLAMQLDGPTMFHNPTEAAARYAVVIAAEGRA